MADPIYVSEIDRCSISTTVKCPCCKRPIVLWAIEVQGEAAFSIDDQGVVYPIAVCLNQRNGRYCNFSGFVRIKRYKARRYE